MKTSIGDVLCTSVLGGKIEKDEIGVVTGGKKTRALSSENINFPELNIKEGLFNSSARISLYTI